MCACSPCVFLSSVKNQHIRLGHPWTDFLDWEMKDGKPACDDALDTKILSIPHAEVGHFTTPCTARHATAFFVVVGGQCRSSCLARCVHSHVLGWTWLWTCVSVEEGDSHVCLFGRDLISPRPTLANNFSYFGDLRLPRPILATTCWSKPTLAKPTLAILVRPTLAKTTLAKTDFGQNRPWPKPTLAKTDFGQNRLWPKPTLAKTDFGQNRLWPNRLWPNRV